MKSIPENTFFIVSHGAYSDYQIWAFCKSKKEIKLKELLLEYLQDNPNQKERYHYDASQFMAWLNTKDLYEEIPYFEFHLGDYGEVNRIYLGDPEPEDELLK